MDRYLHKITQYRKPLLVIISALLLTIIVDSLRPKPAQCPEVIATVTATPSAAGLEAEHDAVPLNNVNESVLAAVSLGDTVNVHLVDSNKTFEKLKVLSKNGNGLVVQCPRAQATELAKAQHEKFTLHLQSFTPSGADAAPATTGPGKP